MEYVVTNNDKVINEQHVTASVNVLPVAKKISEKRFKWYGHVKRREEEHMLRRMVDASVPGKRLRGRQQTRWKESCDRDMENVGIMDDLMGRTTWQRNIQNYSADSDYGKKRKRGHILSKFG